MNGSQSAVWPVTQDDRFAEIQSAAAAQKTLNYQMAQVIRLARIVPNVTPIMLSQANRVADAMREVSAAQDALRREQAELAKMLL